MLRSGGVLGLIWNIRDESVPWVRRLTEIMHGSHAEEMLAGGGPQVGPPFDELEARDVAVVAGADPRGAAGMARSRSYIITAPEDERQRHSRRGAGSCSTLRAGGRSALGVEVVDLPYRTHAFRGIRP